MNDGYGRTIDYVRISVTDRCNQRCIYCMPKSGVETVSHQEILNFDEICRLTEIFASLGIKKIKITGGEPLVRKGIPGLAARMKKIPGIDKVTLTTNGVLLAEQMAALAEAGIDGINLSLDTMEPEVFARITRRDFFDDVKKGFEEALKYPKIPLKINCVPMNFPGQNAAGLAALAKEYPVHVRYIEVMPIGLGKQFDGCTEDALLAQLQEKYGAYQVFEGSLGNGPGHYYSFPGFKGKIGFISALSHKFCSTCNRVRLTSQGYLKTCLQYDVGTDLRGMLRDGTPDEKIRQAVEAAIRQKPPGHKFTESAGEHGEQRMMSQIGG